MGLYYHGWRVECDVDGCPVDYENDDEMLDGGENGEECFREEILEDGWHEVDEDTWYCRFHARTLLSVYRDEDLWTVRCSAEADDGYKCDKAFEGYYGGENGEDCNKETYKLVKKDLTAAGWLLMEPEDEFDDEDEWLCPKHARIHLYGPDGRVEDERPMETLELLEGEK